MLQVRDRLFAVSPYLDFDASQHPTDPQGWGSDHPLFGQMLDLLRPATIIEVGTWKGASAIHMAGIAKRLGLSAEIICIDTWLGSSEHILGGIPGARASLRRVNGYPSLYYTFLSNVAAAGMQDVITPFPVTSETGAVVLSSFGVVADFIYIDASHEYGAVLRDLQAFWPLLSENGIMMLDDYGYSDVTTAACHFAASVGRPLYASWGKAIISRNGAREFVFSLTGVKP